MTQPPLTPPPGQNGGFDPRRQQPGAAPQGGLGAWGGPPAQGPGRQGPGQQGSGQQGPGRQGPGQHVPGQQPPWGAPPNGQPPAPGQFPHPGAGPGQASGGFGAPGQAPAPGRPPAPGQPQRPGQFPGQPQTGIPGQAPFVQAPPSHLPAGAPPPRYAPQQQATPQPRRRELGEDPELQKQRRRPVGLLLGVGISGVAIVALVVGLVMAFSSPNDPTIPVGGADPNAATSTPVPTSTLMPAAPQDAAPGFIPITTDVVFPNGITVVNPPLGGWEQDISERQPNLYILSDPASGAYFSIAQENLHKSEYRDEDMTRSELNSASLQFTAKPEAVGDPVPLVLKGADGYELELLAQRLRWSDGSEGMMASRYMPSTGTKITILANAWSGELDDPNSRISQKVAEITFTTP
ncbi:hypothetical protein [Pseudoclavibacter sp. RFBG4]|uniref:hypothetical protein n=1 Tax=Pseudoclavibacter sp. RFBG4 TaxID=2080575 RepID=UPI0011AFE221|nr:hypothetical protein [Pseudoclavibacter sp. RFBG4]